MEERARRRADHLARWSAAHGGLTASSPLVRGWLEGVRRCADPLARAGVPPDALTVLALVSSLAALAPAALGGRAALGVPVLLGASALVDGLDGAVAVLSGRATRWGAVLDAGCDRLADAAGLGSLVLLGAPVWWAAVATGAGWLAEYLRARAQGEGLAGPGALTVSERPTRVAVAAMFALGCGCYPSAATAWASVGAGAAAVLAVVGLGQLVAVLPRRLRALR